MTNQTFFVYNLTVTLKAALIISINSSTIAANIEGIIFDTILFVVSKGNIPQY